MATLAGSTLRRGPTGVFYGSDFAMFYGAAQVLEQGGNPYDHVLLYRIERAMLHRQGLPIMRQEGLVRVGNPPVFFWLLRPLTALPFQTAAYIWLGAIILAAVAGFLAALRALGWRRRLLPLLCFLAMPQLFMGIYPGNVVPLVFAALAVTLLLLPRYPLAAGLLMSLAWLKPQVALPVVALLLLFHATAWRRAVMGFGVATLGLLVLTVMTSGLSSVADWVRALTGYSHDITVQADLASLAGLYYRWAPAPLRLGLEGVSLLVALGLTAWLWRQHRALPLPILATGWLWAVWFLATPYAHFDDQILLTIPILALLGRDASRLARPAAAVALYVLFLSILLSFNSLPEVQLLWVPELIVAACLWRGSRESEASGTRSTTASGASSEAVLSLS